MKNKQVSNVIQNPCLKNLNRLEFLVTMACSGQCKHCSEGEHKGTSEFIDGDVAAAMVRRVCSHYKIQSLMTFGGEALLYADTVYKIHAAAKEMNIPQRQLITNGYVTKDAKAIQNMAKQLSDSGVNAILLSVDAFHQETIPLEVVKQFAKEVMEQDLYIRTHPAWLVSPEDANMYNKRTREILREFEKLGIKASEGNVIFPSGNALKYLGEFFEKDEVPDNPYEEDARDIWTISMSPNGDVLDGNVYTTDIMDIIKAYQP